MKTTGLWSEGDNLIERRSFDAEPYIVSPRLTDATDDGGLFGFRFS